MRRFLGKALVCVFSVISILSLISCSSIQHNQKGQRDTLFTNGQGLVYVKSGTNDQVPLNNKHPAMNSLLAAAYNNRGMIFLKEGKYDEAIWDFSRATEIDPGFALAYNNRARAYMKKSDYDQAIHDLEMALTLGEIGHRPWGLKK